MYNINILSNVDDEFVKVAIITAVNEMLGNDNSSINVTRMKRGKCETPIWNMVSRQDF